MKKLCLLFIIGQIFFSASSPAQDRKSANNKRPKYLILESGLSRGGLRDFATSPIIYQGYALNLAAHYLRMDSLKETRFGIRFLGGNYDFQIRNERASTVVNAFHAEFSKLYQLKLLDKPYWNFKLGGQAMLSGNLRSNSALQNASRGIELIYNLMLSGKVSRDVSRRSTKSGKIWFIPYHWEPRKRSLSYRLNVGLFNGNFRNGYAYIDQQAVINDPQLFSDYENQIFQGFRVNSELRYTIYLKNANAISFSYWWDAYTTKGEDPLEMFNHALSFSLWFRLK